MSKLNLASVLHQAHLRFQKQEGIRVSDGLRKAIKFCEPQSETWIRHHRTYKPVGYYRTFCVHDKLFLESCAKCQRKSQL